jgi:hypothetical protein
MLRMLFWLFLLLALISALISKSTIILFLVLAAVVAAIAVGVRKAQILEEWSVLISGAEGQMTKVISNVKELLNARKVPTIEMKEEKVGPELTPVAFGETRDFLIIIDRRTLKLANFKIYINAIDYGNSLFVSWYLTYLPDVWQTLVALLPGTRKIIGLDELDLFNRQDLTAYVTCVHKCVQEGVDRLILEMGQDPSKIDRCSRGFFGIS